MCRVDSGLIALRVVANFDSLLRHDSDFLKRWKKAGDEIQLIGHDTLLIREERRKQMLRKDFGLIYVDSIVIRMEDIKKIKFNYNQVNKGKETVRLVAYCGSALVCMIGMVQLLTSSGQPPTQQFFFWEGLVA